MLGIRFPLQIKNGSLLIGTDNDLIVDRILSVVLTRKGERVMRNDYGISEPLFEDRFQKEEILLELYRQIPNTDFRLSSVSTEDGRFFLNIYYTRNGDIEKRVSTSIPLPNNFGNLN